MYNEKIAFIQVYIYAHRHTYIDIYMWNSMHIVLYKTLFEKIVLLLKIPMETSGLGFPRSSSTLHLKVHIASPK